MLTTRVTFLIPFVVIMRLVKAGFDACEVTFNCEQQALLGDQHSVCVCMIENQQRCRYYFERTMPESNSPKWLALLNLYLFTASDDNGKSRQSDPHSART